MHTVLQDVRYGLRMLAKNPGFSIVAVLTLAVTIGANTTIFTAVNALFLKPLPVAEPARVVTLWTTDAKAAVGNFRLLPMSYVNFQDFREQSEAFEQMADVGFTPLTLSGRAEPEQIPGLLVTGNYFEMLGVQALQGRLINPSDDTGGGNPVAVLSYTVWSRLFGADPNILGKNITLNSNSFTVVGVARPEFKGTFAVANPDLIWMPMAVRRLVQSGFVADNFEDRRALFTLPLGRLKPGVSLEEAQAQLHTIAARLEQQYPEANRGRSVRLVPLNQAALGPNQREQFVKAGTLMLGVVGLVLLIACANLANLLLARGAARSREMSLRAALGAGRGRLLRQLLTESLVLATVGGALGILIASWGRSVLWAYRPPFMDENALELALDGRVFGFVAGISLLTAILFGLLPALRGSDPDLQETLRVGGRTHTAGGGRRLRNGLVTAEVALALVALIGAGLFLRSLRESRQIEPGFESERLFTFAFNIGSRGYTAERGLQFYQSALEAALSTPGVEAAAIATNQPLGGAIAQSVFLEGREQRPGEGTLTTVNRVSAGFFKTLRIPLASGRAFTEFDRSGSTTVAIVTEAAARMLWPDQDPIGKRFTFFGEPELWEVVGVTRNIAVAQVGEDPQPLIFLPLWQTYEPFASLQVRTSGDPGSLLPVVRKKVQELDRDLALVNPATIQEIFAQDQGLWAARVGAALLTLFGAIALLLASMGIYGVMAYSVSQRTQEIGIRMALGAPRGDILRMLLSQGMLPAVAGVVLGGLLTFASARFVSSLLYGVSATDPAIYVSVSLALITIAALAVYVPARRATRLDPVVALRYE